MSEYKLKKFGGYDVVDQHFDAHFTQWWVYIQVKGLMSTVRLYCHQYERLCDDERHAAEIERRKVPMDHAAVNAVAPKSMYNFPDGAKLYGYSRQSGKSVMIKQAIDEHFKQLAAAAKMSAPVFEKRNPLPPESLDYDADDWAPKPFEVRSFATIPLPPGWSVEVESAQTTNAALYRDGAPKKCDCGAQKCGTTHASWCSTAK